MWAELDLVHGSIAVLRTDAREPRRELPMRFRGVPLTISWSWLVFAAVITMLFLPTVRAVMPAASTVVHLLVALCFAGLLLLIVILHEASHAVAAGIFGWPVHRIHVSLWGGETRYSVGGTGAPATPGRMLVVALAGPAANVAAAGLGIALTYLWIPGAAGSLLLLYWIYANWLIAAFNLLPGHPLDGGRLVESAVWKATGDPHRGRLAAGWTGRGVAVAVALAGLLFPLLRAGELDPFYLLIGMLMAVFLWSAASGAIHQSRSELTARRISAEMLMHAAVTVSIRATVADLIRAQVCGADPETGEDTDPPVQVIVPDGTSSRPVALGLVDPRAVAGVDPAEADVTPVMSVAREVNPYAVVALTATGMQLMRRSEETAPSPLIVYDDRAGIVGVIYRADLLQLLASPVLRHG